MAAGGEPRRRRRPWVPAGLQEPRWRETPYEFKKVSLLTSRANLARRAVGPTAGPEGAPPLFLINHWISTDPVAAAEQRREGERLRAAAAAWPRHLPAHPSSPAQPASRSTSTRSATCSGVVNTLERRGGDTVRRARGGWRKRPILAPAVPLINTRRGPTFPEGYMWKRFAHIARTVRGGDRHCGGASVAQAIAGTKHRRLEQESTRASTRTPSRTRSSSALRSRRPAPNAERGKCCARDFRRTALRAPTNATPRHDGGHGGPSAQPVGVRQGERGRNGGGR